MLAHALQFAENYNVRAEISPAQTPKSVRHPSLYVFIGKDGGGVFPLIERYASRFGAAFFLHAGELELSGRSIRQIKTEIQENKAELNIKRVNISLTVNASESIAVKFEEAGQRIREIFCEDTALVHMTLFLLISESNKWDDMERRAAYSYETLKRAETFQTETDGRIFDRVFILSDRNEQDVVSDANMENNALIISGMDSLLSASLSFGERTYFTTAGMARLTKPSFEIAFAVYKRVAERILDLYRETLKKINSDGDEDIMEYLSGYDLESEKRKLIEKMQGIASRNVFVLSLRGKTLKEAEAILYGDGAQRFFSANFKPKTNPPAFPVTVPITAYETSLSALKIEAGDLQSRLEKIYSGECKPGLVGGINAVRQKIAEAYGIRFKLETVHNIIEETQAGLERAHVFRKKLESFVKELSFAVEELNRRPDPGQHITAHYGRITDAETARFLNLDYFGTEPDLNILFEKIPGFIEDNIFPHEAFSLTFDEELQKRAAATPGEYDSEFYSTDEFYRRTLADLDRQSVLAISLIRYDSLYREKYYFGSADSQLLKYAKQMSANETVYTLDEPSGFTVVRLAGGFTVEDMTRYRIMAESYKKVSGKWNED